MKKVWPPHPDSYKQQAFINAILPIISTELRNLHSLEYTQRTRSKTEGLARVFVTRWKTTALSDRCV